MRSLSRIRILSIATLCCGSASQAAEQSGFIEGSSANLVLRNFYINRAYTNDAHPQNKAEEWTQSFILDYRSGFTEGPVGFGVDVLGKLAIKLDGGRGTTGTLIPVRDDGRPADDFGRLGVAAKMRISKTELKVGELMPNTPVLAADDGRAIPQTFEGALLTSKEFDRLTLSAGQFRRSAARNDDSMEKLTLNQVSGFTSDRFNLAGGDYLINENRTLLRAWYGELEDIYGQKYLAVYHTQPLNEQVSLNAKLQYYWGDETGSAKAGDLDNRTFSSLVGVQAGAHTVSVGLQKISGDNGWFKVGNAAAGILVNDTFNNSYDNPHEKSWQVRYDLNFAPYGVPGLSFMTRYLKGTHVQTAQVDDGTEYGRESELAYVFQSGAFKDLSLRWRQSTLRRDFGTNEYDEHRLIINYPISLL
ncbi:OprD family porin [Pseudomonas mangiferae]|uniref:OprD family porin n=1 Tax=Pseudomonas mangiferae TaxID=2593654 RepID=A0A553GTN0_9PSED|nr:OprD family porin [Pseudomonas mangiferae]TRX72826.1 OprD family porin [Pseudomonas mangiferae]